LVPFASLHRNICWSLRSTTSDQSVLVMFTPCKRQSVHVQAAMSWHCSGTASDQSKLGTGSMALMLWLYQ
jgi:hypothetical protein